MVTDVADAFANERRPLHACSIYSSERTAKAFENLFWQADLRFHVIDIEKPRGSALAIIEVGWRSEEWLDLR